MPLFEFVCRDCGHRFEALVTGGRAAACPACHSALLEKLVSSFGARTTGPRTAPASSSSRFT